MPGSIHRSTDTRARTAGYAIAGPAAAAIGAGHALAIAGGMIVVPAIIPATLPAVRAIIRHEDGTRLSVPMTRDSWRWRSEHGQYLLCSDDEHQVDSDPSWASLVRT